MNPNFSIKEALTFGWNTFKSNPLIFIGASLVYMVIQFVLGFVQGMLPELLAPILSIIVGTLMSIGIMTFYLKAHDDAKGVNLKLLWNPKPFLKYLVTSFVMAALIVIGFLLLIVPGIILALAWSFALYITIERGVWTKTALLESARITRGSRVKLFMLALILAVMNIVGMLLLMIGLLVSVPISLLASIHAYRKLSASPAAVAAPTPMPAAANTTPVA